MCRSPFEVQVGAEAGFQKVRAWGPGLKTGMVGKSADFVVEAIGTEVGTLGKMCAGYASSYERKVIPFFSAFKAELYTCECFIFLRLLD